jgi:hypothetical protein
MAVNNPYFRRWKEYGEESYLPIKLPYGDAVYITKDGKIKARGFVDYNDDIELFMDKDKIKSRYRLSETSIKNFVVQHDNEYIYTLTSANLLDECFQNYLNPPHLYSNTEPPAHQRKSKFKLLSKQTKAAVNSAVIGDAQTPRSFQWGFTKDNKTHVEPHIEGSWLGPFNYDVYLSAEEIIQDAGDLIVIKSGMYNRRLPDSTKYYLGNVTFSTGVSGHIYAETPSIPKHGAGPFTEYGGVIPRDNRVVYKIPRTGNANQGPETAHSGVFDGPIGLMKNGVCLHSPLNGKSYATSGVWNENSVVSEKDETDACGGSIHSDGNRPNAGVYHYKEVPGCMFDLSDVSKHSPLIGYAMDGYPIYGPMGYSSANDSSSSLKKIDASYRLKLAANRAGTDAPNFVQFTSGFFVEDYEYVQGLGDLDEHNGRTCVTPEYPQGTYAYFTTVDDIWEPAYPYVVGPTFYGKINPEIGHVGTITEPVYQRMNFLTDEQRNSLYSTTPDIGSWLLYSDEVWIDDGLYGESVLWVSPHLLKEAQGIFLTTGYKQNLQSSGIWDYTLHTGSGIATYSGSKYMATGNGHFLPMQMPFIYPTSKECNLLKGFPFSGGMKFLYTDPSTDTTFEGTAPLKIQDSEFFEIYSGHRFVSGTSRHRVPKIYNGHWDGKIPAGTPFKIETWSFNGFDAGFDGAVSIWPCQPHPLTSGNLITISSTTSGVGPTEGEAYQDAIDKNKKEQHKMLSTLLINSGVKNETAKMRRYRKLREPTNFTPS